jgi:hypothetical protein
MVFFRVSFICANCFCLVQTNRKSALAPLSVWGIKKALFIVKYTDFALIQTRRRAEVHKKEPFPLYERLFSFSRCAMRQPA